MILFSLDDSRRLEPPKIIRFLRNRAGSLIRRFLIRWRIHGKCLTHRRPFLDRTPPLSTIVDLKANIIRRSRSLDEVFCPFLRLLVSKLVGTSPGSPFGILVPPHVIFTSVRIHAFLLQVSLYTTPSALRSYS